MFARLAVNIPAISGIFDYSILPELAPHLRAGCLVTAPFGNQTVQGIIVELTNSSSINLKPILDLLDPAPLLTAPQLALAMRLADSTLNPLSAIIGMMIPTGLSQQADVDYELRVMSYRRKNICYFNSFDKPTHRTRTPARTSDRLSLRQSGLAQDRQHPRQKRCGDFEERSHRRAYAQGSPHNPLPSRPKRLRRR